MNDKLLESTHSIDEFHELGSEYAEWYDFFVKKLSILDTEERQFLSGVFNFHTIPGLFTNIVYSFDSSCIYGPSTDLSLITGKFSYDGFGHLYAYSYLPSNHFHQAVLAGLGLGFWYQHVLMEYMADQTLKCPEIRGIEFIEQSSKKPLSVDVETIFEASEIVSLGYKGFFNPLALKRWKIPNLYLPTLGRHLKKNPVYLKIFLLYYNNTSSPTVGTYRTFLKTL